MKNAVTGLEESVFEPLNLPLVLQRQAMSLDLRGQVRAVHVVPLANGETLHAYVDARRSEDLVVLFSSRSRKGGRAGQPVFEGVSGLRRRGTAVVILEDPTTTRTGLPGWFLGNSAGDPIPEIAHIVRKAAGKAGATRVVLCGYQAAAHGVLRAFAHLSDVRAVVVDPDVDPARSRWKGAYREVLEGGWAGQQVHRAREEQPERFNVLDRFRERPPVGELTVLQSISDVATLEAGYLPLKDLYLLESAAGLDMTELKQFILDDARMSTSSPFDRLMGAVFADIREEA